MATRNCRSTQKKPCMTDHSRSYQMRLSADGFCVSLSSVVVSIHLFNDGVPDKVEARHEESSYHDVGSFKRDNLAHLVF
jgi:hypothetical protein